MVTESQMGRFTSVGKVLMKTVDIFTDGACSGNPGPGGWAALLRYQQQEKTLSGAEADTTNNRMELMAVIQALAELKHTCMVNVYTDSQYVVKGMTEWLFAWQRKHWRTASNQPVKNADLWQRLVEVAKPHEIQWHWVRGHSGHIENERVDSLARQAILTLQS